MSNALMINSEAPFFSLEGVQEGKVKKFSSPDFRGQWLILFFYPADFTFVCPTETIGFSRRLKEFWELNCSVLGVSVDDIKSHKEWAEELKLGKLPLLSDTTSEMSKSFCILNEADKRAHRATFIISPDGQIVYFVVSPLNVGRSVEETLRVLKALQTGRLCPADWKPGEDTIEEPTKA